jgi:flagellar biosynthesis GTPase FlhF
MAKTVKKTVKLPSSESVLHESLSDKYQVAEGVLTVFADSELGHIDLTKIDEGTAVRLAERGYLIKISPGG